ncbi:glycosyltransferase [Pseudomonas viridiflava]|uniref:glycosyltransferase n=1 Tax=Pseudomonas viridiflava TaxID=33069 RepID=UPI000F05EE6B|nr:glycosyltransferase [Pseudomonas viridiflava]
MRLSYLSNSPLSASVANAVHVMNICACFAESGHEVVLHAKCEPEKVADLYQQYGVPATFRISGVPPSRFRRLGVIAYGAKQALHARFVVKPDIAYARCLLSAAFAVALQMEVILELHEIPQGRLLSALLRRLLASRRVRRVVVISGGLMEDLKAAFPESLGKDCLVAHDGASVPSTFVSKELPPTDGCHIGYAGGLRSGNGVELILELASRFTEHSFHIVGGSDDEIGLWKQRQSSPNVYWHGRLPPAHVHGFLTACDILLAPYQHGPKTASGRDTSRWMSPLKIFEYMASGVPMLVSDFPVLREVLDQKTAMLLSPEDTSAWEQGIAQLAQSPQRRAQMGAAAFGVYQENYTWLARSRLVLQGLQV